MNLLRLITARGGSPYDPNAQAFITAAGITNATQKTAINQLVLDLKSYGLWTKMKAVYPFVGGTATTHKYNLINPLDTNAAYRMGFTGPWVHDANGITGNGVTGANATQGNTYINASTKLSLNNASISIYIRTDNSGNYVDMSTPGGTLTPTIQVRLNDTTYFHVGAGTYSTAAASTSLGYYLASRTSSTNQILYRNGSSIINGAVNSTAMVNDNIYINGYNNGYITNRNYAFCTVGEGLDATEAANLYTAVQAYQTRLGRQV